MPTEDVAYQQRLKIRRTTLGFGVIQVVLGLALTGLSFTAFVLSESEKIRNACPYWAGFTVFCSGGVGIVAWRHTTILSMGLFTFFSAVCVVLHMIGTILTGEIGGLLKSIIMCQGNILKQSCMCCDSIMTCKQNVPTLEFKGVDDCAIITGLVKELMYGLCVLNIFGSLVCFIATILGCTSVARQAGRDQPFFRRRLSARSDSHDQSQYSWLHYPADANVLPPYAPPIYRSVDNVQDCGATPYIVPPPVFDPTDLPPPYSSRNASLSSSGISLDVHEPHPPGGRRPHDRDDSAGGSSAIVLSEGGTVIHHHYENHYQQRVYSENRVRPGNLSQITSVVLTRSGISERCGPGAITEQSIQSVNSSHVSLHSEKAEECRESNENINNQDNKYKSKQTARIRSTVEHADELITFEENQNKRKSNKESKRNPSKSNHRKSCKVTEDEFSSTSDSGIGEEISVTIVTDIETNSQDTHELEGNEPCDKDVGASEDLGVDVSTPDREQQDGDLNHLTFSTRDAVSLDGPTAEDNIRGSNDTLVNLGGSVDEIGACQSGNLGLTEGLVEDLPTILPLNPKQDQGEEDETICTSKVEKEINVDFENDDIVEKSEIWTVEDTVPQKKSREKHITDEVIRLMDDFEAKSNINRTYIGAFAPGCSLDTSVEELAKNITKDEASNEMKAQPYKSAHPGHALPLGTKVELRSHQGRELLGRNVTSLARSDTCIAVLPRPPRDIRTGSDPSARGVGSLTYPGLNHFPFQLVPPNVELPLEIQEENMCRSLSAHEIKRRKRHGGEREVARSKRRALANKDELLRLKVKNQHRSTRKDETTRLRERSLKSQNPRVRVEAARNYWQAYKGKCTALRAGEELLRNPMATPSLKKGKNGQRHNASSRQCPDTASECGTTGKETIV